MILVLLRPPTGNSNLRVPGIMAVKKGSGLAATERSETPALDPGDTALIVNSVIVIVIYMITISRTADPLFFADNLAPGLALGLRGAATG